MTDWLVSTDLLAKGARFPPARASGIAAAGGDLVMPGSKEDYANVLEGLKNGKLTRTQLALLELYRVTLDAAYLQEVIHRAGQMVVLFEDSQGGYFMTAADSEQLIARPKETYDGAILSGNSVAAMVLQRLAALTGERKWQDAAQRQMSFSELGL